MPNNFSSIYHLAGSKLGHKDKEHSIEQAKQFTEILREGRMNNRKPKNEWELFVTEKLDGSNISIKFDEHAIPSAISRAEHPLNNPTRRGYISHTQANKFILKHNIAWLIHEEFGDFVKDKQFVFEWMGHTHGIYYRTGASPLVLLAIKDIKDPKKVRYMHTRKMRDAVDNLLGFISLPELIYSGMEALSLNNAIVGLGEKGHYGAAKGDSAEGVVYALEKYNKADPDALFSPHVERAKFVQANFIAGKYFPENGYVNKNHFNVTGFTDEYRNIL